MQNQNKYFIVSILIILFSTPLGYKAMSIFYDNLTSEYNILLIGHIFSFILLGILIFIIGLRK